MSVLSICLEMKVDVHNFLLFYIETEENKKQAGAELCQAQVQLS